MELFKVLSKAGIGLLMAYGFTSCVKYDEGGNSLEAGMHLSSGQWQLEQYLRDGIDETEAVMVNNLSELFSENGIFTRSFETNQSPVNRTGSWNFVDGRRKISIDGRDSVLLRDNLYLADETYVIIKIDEDAFWYYFIKHGEIHEFHFKPG